MIATTIQDLRSAVRVLVSSWTLTCISIICLSLGIGTNATVFAFVNALILQPLPLAEPNRLVAVQEVRREDPGNPSLVSYPNFLDWRAHKVKNVTMAAQRSVPFLVSTHGAPEPEAGALVSWNMFDLLGVRPLLGRGFIEDDERSESSIVVLSHALWQRRYSGDPTVIGRNIIVNETPHTVIGIMPQAFSHVALDRALQGARLWIPFQSGDLISRRDERVITVIGRLGNGATLEVARAELSSAAQTLERMHPDENDGWGVAVQPLRVGFSRTSRTMMLLMLGAVTFVLLIGCANVANLTLARTQARRREIATCLALGASPGRILRQLVAENALVALVSVPAGILFAYWGRSLLLRGQERLDPDAIVIDSGVLAYTIGLATLACLLSGFLPALRAMHYFKCTTLLTGRDREGALGPRHARLTSALVVSEIALACVLLVGASLFTQSFRNALLAEGGFDTAHILSIRLAAAAGAHPGPTGLVTEAIEMLSALPDASNVAAASFMPLRSGGSKSAVVSDAHDEGLRNLPTVFFGGVTSEFFRLLNVPIVDGRMFTPAEAHMPIAVINKVMANRLWPGENAIGHTFRRAEDVSGWFTVVGVSDDILAWDVSDRPQPTAYVPYSYVPVERPTVFVQTRGDPALLAPSVRASLGAVDHAQAFADIRTMTDVHYEALTRMRTLASLFVIVSSIAVILGAAGVYGVLSHFASLRTRELGIRAALGADRTMLVRRHVWQGMKMVTIGIALGVVCSLVLARVVRALLHDVEPTDPVSLAGAVLALIVVGFLATYLPARRAANVDPVVAIRSW